MADAPEEGALNSSRRLPDQVRASITSTLGLSVNWPRVRDEFSEAELSECEGLVGLKHPNAEFRAAITDAVFLALCLHTSPPKRASTVRKEMTLLAKRAVEAATALQQLSAAFDQAVPLLRSRDAPPEPAATLMASATLDHLRSLAEAARQSAQGTKADVGGRTRMVAFDIFIRTLADAFGRATRQPAGLTWNPDDTSYEGRFWDLVDRVLPRAEMIAGKFAPESHIALGRQIQRILTRMDITSATRPK
jgi:hypothetical protein